MCACSVQIAVRRIIFIAATPEIIFCDFIISGEKCQVFSKKKIDNFSPDISQNLCDILPHISFQGCNAAGTLICLSKIKLDRHIAVNVVFVATRLTVCIQFEGERTVKMIFVQP